MTTSKTAVAKVKKAEVAVTASWTTEQVELIKSQFAVGTTDDELKLFLYVAHKTGLDPMTRQIYCIKRKTWNKEKRAYEEKMTIQTGIDGYRAIAVRSGLLAGIDDATYDTETGTPSKASVTVYRLVGGIRCPFTATARWSEYAQMKDEYQNNEKTGKQAPSGQWGKMPFVMLAKCAEALALRKAFPNDLSGIYTTEEMQQADNEHAPMIQAAEVTVPAIAAPEENAKEPVLCEHCLKGNKRVVLSAVEVEASMAETGGKFCPASLVAWRKAKKPQDGSGAAGGGSSGEEPSKPSPAPQAQPGGQPGPVAATTTGEMGRGGRGKLEIMTEYRQQFANAKTVKEVEDILGMRVLDKEVTSSPMLDAAVQGLAKDRLGEMRIAKPKDPKPSDDNGMCALCGGSGKFRGTECGDCAGAGVI